MFWLLTFDINMIDYKKYIAVLEIVRTTNSDEVRASEICELFDQKPAQSIGWFWYVKPMTLWDHLKNTPTPVTFPLDLNRATCVCTDKTDCEWYN
jgi:hypothetical protein